MKFRLVGLFLFFIPYSILVDIRSFRLLPCQITMSVSVPSLCRMVAPKCYRLCGLKTWKCTISLSHRLFPVMYYMMRCSGDLSLDYGAGAAMTEEHGGDAAIDEDDGTVMTEHNGGEAAMGDGPVAAMTEENGGAAAMDDVFDS